MNDLSNHSNLDGPNGRSLGNRARDQHQEVNPHQQPHQQPKRSLNRQSQSCSVCGDRAYYVFYGAVACDSCRTFFRRQVLHSKVLSCHFKNQCQIQLNTRKDCAKCRLDKCLSVGMKQSLVAIGESDPSPPSNGNNNNNNNHFSSSQAPSQDNQSEIDAQMKKPMINFQSVFPVAGRVREDQKTSAEFSSIQTPQSAGPSLAQSVSKEINPYHHQQQQSILPSILEGRHIVTSPLMSSPTPRSEDFRRLRDTMSSSSSSSNSNSPSSPRNPQYYGQQYWSDSHRQSNPNHEYSMVTSPRFPSPRDSRDHFYDERSSHRFYGLSNMSSSSLYHQGRSSLDSSIASEDLLRLQRNAARRGSYQEPTSHHHMPYLYQQPGCYDRLGGHSRTYSDDSSSNLMCQGRILRETDSSEPMSALAKTVVTPTSSPTPSVKLHPKIACKNELNQGMMQQQNNCGKNNNRENELDTRQSSLLSKRKDSNEDIPAKDILPFKRPIITSITSTVKPCKSETRMVHPKFRGRTTTNLLVSCKDSKSGDIKESFEIKNLSSTERERMIEVIQAAKLLEVHDNRDSNEDDDDSILSIMKQEHILHEEQDRKAEKFVLQELLLLSAQKIIEVAQQLKPFQLLPETDKMILLKGSIAEILFLRSAQVFDKQEKCWKMSSFTNSSLIPQVIPMEVLQASDATKQLYDKYQNFVDSFDENLANDSVLINLMCAICLFTVRDGLFEKEMIRCERTLYLRLLEQYINCKFQGHDVLYKSLVFKFHELTIMKDMYEKTSVNPDDVNTLVKPCRGMKISNSPPPEIPTTTTSVTLISYPPTTTGCN